MTGLAGWCSCSPDAYLCMGQVVALIGMKRQAQATLDLRWYNTVSIAVAGVM